MSDLILVPTHGEMESLRRQLPGATQLDQWAFQICGFGPIAAAARASALISRYQPQRVMLIGIAGSYEVQKHPIGSACRFDHVACTGIGVGLGVDHLGAEQLGWQQFSGEDAAPRIGDLIELPSTFVPGVPSAGLLLTCCSASGTLEEADQRRMRFPDAAAEDMEGFGVALSCAMASVELQIVRGISNRAGDRDLDRWRIDEALAAAGQLAADLAGRAWLPSQS